MGGGICAGVVQVFEDGDGRIVLGLMGRRDGEAGLLMR